MTSSSPSPDPAGFAKHSNEGGRLPLTGQFLDEMHGPLGGVFIQDMPTARPGRGRPKVKGVPGASTGSPGEDYQSGQGTWREVE